MLKIKLKTYYTFLLESRLVSRHVHFTESPSLYLFLHQTSHLGFAFVCVFTSGRLTLTNYALYFESGVGLYDKAVRYDLSTDMKQVLKPELTGPLGARLFDKAVMYKSISMYVL